MSFDKDLFSDDLSFLENVPESRVRLVTQKCGAKYLKCEDLNGSEIRLHFSL